MAENDFQSPDGVFHIKARRHEITRELLEIKEATAIETDRLYDHLTPCLCTASRTLLRWDRRDLAGAARVSHSTIQRYEKEGAGTEKIIWKIEQALEKAGIQFIDNGVRLRRPHEPNDTSLGLELRRRAAALAERHTPRPDLDYCFLTVCTAYELAVRAGYGAPLEAVDQLIEAEAIFAI